jgi:hypothetical protein
MQKLTDSIEIKTNTENVFQWFINIDKNYKSWHPDHISWDWESWGSFQIGSKAIAKEYIHGKVHSLKSIITNIKKNEMIEYDFLFPTSIIIKRGSFIFSNTNSSCIFTATLTFRFGKFFSKLFKKQMEATIKHMKEEGENLKRLLEKNKI